MPHGHVSMSVGTAITSNLFTAKRNGLNFPRHVVCVTAIFGQGAELFYDWGVTLKSEMDSFTSFPALILKIAKKSGYTFY